ncbi:hypothetical protein RUND412_011161 [Rhizina undulata]
MFLLRRLSIRTHVIIFGLIVLWVYSLPELPRGSSWTGFNNSCSEISQVSTVIFQVAEGNKSEKHTSQPLYAQGHWNNDPETEDYNSLLSPSQKALLQNILQNHRTPSLNGLPDPYSPPHTKEEKSKTFYELKTYSDWNAYLKTLKPGSLAPLTAFTQHYLHSQQYPANCSDQKFIVMKRFPNEEEFGLGAIAGAVSMNLNIAIRTGRVLVYDDEESPGEHFISEGGEGICGRNLDCVFLPISNCSVREAKGKNDTVVLPLEGGAPEIFYRTHPGSIPPLFGEVLKRRGVTAEERKYWWRAQTAGFVLRPNGVVMDELTRLRDIRDEEARWSIHVRHGDKGIEMKLVALKEYVKRAEQYIAENPFGKLRRKAFLSTEDPEVLVQAAEFKGWEWEWSDIPRPEEQLRMSGNRTELTVRWVLQLALAVECQGFVGTRGSGWNRLIDGLRCVWVEGCDAPFLEVGNKESWLAYGP